MAVGGTDSELQGLASADVDLGSGYRLESCRVGAAWAVVPNDVIAIDLLAVGDRFDTASWVTTASDELQRSFEGVFEGSFGRRRRQETHPALQLFVSGRLLVQSVSRAAAARIACVFVGWLVEADVSDEER